MNIDPSNGTDPSDRITAGEERTGAMRMTDRTDARAGERVDRRRGIALVIVLGLMAMLIVMGLSFAVSMRTEHRAAREASSQLGTVEMVYSGLARAMTHIEHTLSGGIPWTNFALTSGGYPYVTMAAPGGQLPREQIINWGAAPINARADLLSHYGLWFSPAGLLNIARDETNRVRWIRVRDPRDNSAIGQYAYIVLDCSGLLDINGNHERDPLLGRALPRGPGTNVSELALANAILRELRSGAESNLFNGRIGIDRYKPFGHVDTIADARPATMAMYPDRLSVNTPTSPFRIYHFPTNFTTYTRFPSGYWDVNNNMVAQPQYIGGSAADIAARAAEIEAEFVAAGFPAAYAGALVTNLIDYVDDDFIPGGLAATIAPNSANADSFCTEPVPMLNELQIGSNYRPVGGNIQLNMIIRMEMFFPFLFTSNSLAYPDLTFRFKARLQGGTFDPSDLPVQTYNVPANLWVRHAVPATPSSTQFPVAQFIVRALAPTTNAVAPERLIVTECAIVDAAGRVVDRIQPDASGEVMNFVFSDYFSPDVLSGAAAYYSSWAVVDPRINWDFEDHWPELYKGQNLASLDGHPRNSFTRMNPDAHDGYGTLGERSEWFMYVKNGPLISAGELGYLLYSPVNPWKTIDLFGADARPVLDRFTVFYQPIRHGLVNLNKSTISNEFWSKGGSYYNVNQKQSLELYQNPLATAFNQCRIEVAPDISPPGLAANARINVAQARELAAVMQTTTYTNVSDIRNTEMHNWNGVPSWMARKGLIRNTHGLLGVRSSTFVVILVGQAQRTYVDPETGATRTQWLGGWRGIATLWRDPYPTQDASGNLRNRMFIRNLRWYDEWVGGMEEMDN